MRPSIFDVLEGGFGAGPRLEETPESERTMQSIVANLERLFNTRRDALAHLPDFGLPDLTTVYLEAPDSFDRLRRAVREAAERYEPRLKRVHVEIADSQPQHMRTTFILSGELSRGRRVRFETTFISQDLTTVRNL